MKSIIALICCLITVSMLCAQAPQLQTNYPTTNGTVFTIVKDTANNLVYIGGAFTQVGDSVRNRIACIDSMGKVTSWNPDANGWIMALVISNNTIYAGGTFTSIGGQTRNYIAALNTSTGLATSWNPSANDQVTALAISGNMYVGGKFTSIGGQTRNFIGAIDINTGSATAWNPNASNFVWTLSVSNSTIYIGGDFTTISGQTRNRIAAYDLNSGSISTFNPNANGQVRKMAISGTTVYLAGYFLSIGGQTRHGIAAVDASTGAATNWYPNPTNPNTNTSCTGIGVFDGIIYVSGNFTNIGGQSRSNLAAIDINGTATAWNPNANSSAYAYVKSGDLLYLGGFFGSIGGQTRHYFAVFSGNYTLPVQWLDFTVDCKYDKAILQWSTATELNNSNFEIERSIDNENFLYRGTVKGNGTTTAIKEYSFEDNIDEFMGAPIIYYRLKQIDFNGKSEYSKVVAVNTKRDKSCAVFPNPVTNLLTISLNEIHSEKSLVVQILNTLGVVIATDIVPAGIKTLTHDFSGFVPGIYSVVVSEGSNIITRKAIKQ